MIIELIIVILGMLTAFYSGFYFGYLKREDKKPELPKPFEGVRYVMKKGSKDKEVRYGFYGQKLDE